MGGVVVQRARSAHDRRGRGADENTSEQKSTAAGGEGEALYGLDLVRYNTLTKGRLWALTFAATAWGPVFAGPTEFSENKWFPPSEIGRVFLGRGKKLGRQSSVLLAVKLAA